MHATKRNRFSASSRPGAATSRQPRRRGLPPGTAAASERPHGCRVTAHGCQTNDPCGDETALSCVSCGVRVCACSVHSRVVYCTSYTVLHCRHSLHYVTLFYTMIHYLTECVPVPSALESCVHTSYTVLLSRHSLTLCYTILHNDTLSYTILHYFTLSYTISHYCKLSFSHCRTETNVG